MDHNPYREFAGTIEEHANKKTTQHTKTIRSKLGTITTSGLMVDGFKQEFRDYLYNDLLTNLNDGDRVVVVPINNGKDYVVIARVKRHA
jgi:molybdopterin converting factor small subunit